MGIRVLGVALALAVLAAAAGWGVGRLTAEGPVHVAVAAPVPARDPSLPVDPQEPFADDIDYPALTSDLRYQAHRIGNPPYAWDYRVPAGWVPSPGGLAEVRWRPEGEPTVGGYSVRVKLVNEHKTRTAMVTQKLAAMQSGYEDVVVLGQTQDLLSFSYRDPTTDRQRFNTFQWFSVPGDDEARFEMSVVGRAVDRVGLEALQQHVADSISKR